MGRPTDVERYVRNRKKKMEEEKFTVTINRLQAEQVKEILSYVIEQACSFDGKDKGDLGCWFQFCDINKKGEAVPDLKRLSSVKDVCHALKDINEHI